MLARQRAITRMFTRVLHGMDAREPSARDWAIAKRVCAVLEYPCKLVIKSQDKGHWLVTHALDNMCRLYVEASQRLATLQLGSEATYDDGLDAVEVAMLTALLEHLKKFVQPLTNYEPDRAHVAMAMLCDHRFRRGDMFYWMTDAMLPEEERLEQYQALMGQYTDNHLVEAMVAMKLGQARPRQSSGQQPTCRPSSNTTTAFTLPDVMLPCDRLPSGGAASHSAKERMRVEAKVELERFRAKDSVSEDARTQHPLAWWRGNEHLYPMLANVARVALSCPGSQIECERVFSLCGLTVSLLRNRMTTDNLAHVVYLSKNTDQMAAMQDILSKTHGIINADNWLHQKEGDHYPNMPLAETKVLDSMSDIDGDESWDVPIEDNEETIVLENPHDWDDVVGDQIAHDECTF